MQGYFTQLSEGHGEVCMSGRHYLERNHRQHEYESIWKDKIQWHLEGKFASFSKLLRQETSLGQHTDGPTCSLFFSDKTCGFSET